MKPRKKLKNKWFEEGISNQTLSDLQKLLINLNDTITPIVNVPENINNLDDEFVDNSIPVKLIYNLLGWERIMVKFFFHLNNENQLTEDITVKFKDKVPFEQNINYLYDSILINDVFYKYFSENIENDPVNFQKRI